MGPLSRGMVIGVSLSKPHTNRYYKKTAVLCMYMYVQCTCIYVAIRLASSKRMCIIIVVKIINVGNVLTLNIAHQNMQLASIQKDG